MKKPLLLIIAASLSLVACEETPLDKQVSDVPNSLSSHEESGWLQLTNIIPNEDAPGEHLTEGFGFLIGNKGYIGSGGYENHSLREYDINSDTWSILAPRLDPRVRPVAFSIGARGYVGTGSMQAGGGETYGIKEFYQYNPTTDAFSLKAPVPINFSGAIGFSINGKGYIGIGVTDTVKPNENGEYETFYSPSNHFYEYNPASNCWVRKADFPGAFRTDAVGFSIGNKGFVGTGLKYGEQESLSDFWEYDPSKDKWTKRADVPGPARTNAVGFGLGNKGYIGTGRNTGGGPDRYLKDFWEYEPSSNTWNQIADFPGGERYNLLYFTSSTKAYMGGGEGINTVYNDFWEFDPKK